MALTIKNPEVVKLATEVATLAQETKTEAIRRALLDRKQRLIIRRGNATRHDRLMAVLRNRIWPQIPPDVLGRRMSQQEWEEVLGYGPDGV